jgi:hypothetical protein
VEEDEKEKGPQVEIKISDESGKMIRTFKAPAKLGVNRAVWNLRRDNFKEPSRGDEPRFFEPSGPEVLPGTYSVTIKYKDQEAKGAVKVLPDPRYNISSADRQAKWAAIQRAGELQEIVTEAIERIRSTQADIDVVMKKATPDKKDEKENPYKPLLEAAKPLKQALAEMEKRLWVPPKTKGIVADTDVMQKIQYAGGAMESSWEAPTPAQLAYLRQAEVVLEKVLADYNKLFAEQVAGFRNKVQQAQIAILPTKEALQIKK